MDEVSLEIIEKYHYKVAAVFVYPMEVLSGPNQVSPLGEKLTAGKRFKNRASAALNARFTEHALPLRMVSFANTFTVDYILDCLYIRMYPHFQMAEGMYFSNQSTGKFNFFDYYFEGGLHELAAKFAWPRG